MTQTDLAHFRGVLAAKRTELTKSRGLECIAIERCPEVMEEADNKNARELAIAGLNLESAIRRSVAAALRRIEDRSFGTCLHCGDEIGRRRLEAVPWAPLCIVCQEAADRGEDYVLESVAPTFSDAA